MQVRGRGWLEVVRTIGQVQLQGIGLIRTVVQNAGSHSSSHGCQHGLLQFMLSFCRVVMF